MAWTKRRDYVGQKNPLVQRSFFAWSKYWYLNKAYAFLAVWGHIFRHECQMSNASATGGDYVRGLSNLKYWSADGKRICISSKPELRIASQPVMNKKKHPRWSSWSLLLSQLSPTATQQLDDDQIVCLFNIQLFGVMVIFTFWWTDRSINKIHKNFDCTSQGT